VREKAASANTLRSRFSASSLLPDPWEIAARVPNPEAGIMKKLRTIKKADNTGRLDRAQVREVVTRVREARTNPQPPASIESPGSESAAGQTVPADTSDIADTETPRDDRS
jgi:hypothetical protein